METATFGSGCFWCTEAVFQQLKGVTSVVSGFSGGNVENPSYEQVITGRTGHAEVCQIEFDPAEISYEELLEVFFSTHDPTTLNRQGNDVGTQYRSAIFAANDQQRRTAETVRKRVNDSGKWDAPVVTQIVAAGQFFPAESYHQDYLEKHPEAVRKFVQALDMARKVINDDPKEAIRIYSKYNNIDQASNKKPFQLAQFDSPPVIYTYGLAESYKMMRKFNLLKKPIGVSKMVDDRFAKSMSGPY